MAMRNLSKCLNSNKGPPMDVTFLFKNGADVREIKAHKTILAIASDVFEREFYGSVKEPEDDINIVDASHEVFQTMINFIYNKRPVWINFDLKFLASLYYSAEKYNIVDLKADIIESIPNHKISKAYVLEIGILAEENIHHEQLSYVLYELVATFLLKEFNGELVKSLNFFYTNEENEIHAVVIFKIMAAINKVHSYRVIEVSLVYLDPMKTSKRFRVHVSKLGKMSDLCSALARLAKLPDHERMTVADVYNHRFHKIYIGEDKLSDILDRDDIFVYEIDNSDPQQLVIPVYMWEKEQKLFGLPKLVSLPKTSTAPQLYEILTERMSGYVTRPAPENDWWKSEDGGSDEDGSSDAGPLMFSFHLTNSYGNANISSFNGAENITFNCNSYLSLEWHAKAKQKFYNEEREKDF